VTSELRPAERRIGGPAEIADRLALRALVDEYAAVADARDHAAFAALFEQRTLSIRWLESRPVEEGDLLR
jgi:hypothetical protein